MIANYLSAVWRAVAPAVGNHLWQSTLFAIAAGLLTLVLRKNQARIRYWLWLVASMKFLIPFSLLVGIGSLLTWSQHPARTNAGLYIAMEQVSQPFTQPTISVIPQGTASTGLIYLLPAILSAVWLCGVLAVVFVWYTRWRRVSASLREAKPLREGRELQALRRLDRMGRMRKPIAVYLSRTSLEPGIFGITHPVLIWRRGISERLEDAHLDAILAHELWHVRRRDNLAAAVHMLVEAIFWFHPLVWWLGTRLVEERERACDEAVLESGSDRQIYAESILKICEFCVGSPLDCVSGVTGSDLKERMIHIMTKNSSRKLNLSKKLLLSAAGLIAVAAPIAIGLLHATQTRDESQAHDATASAPAFDATSINPNKNGEPMNGFKISGRPARGIMWKVDRFMATNFSLRMLIQKVYDVQAEQISGGPSWLNSENFDIEAKLDQSSVDALAKLTPDQGQMERQRMLQALLSDRFKLVFHHETKELPVYALVVAKNGSKIHPAKADDTYPNGLKCFGGRPCGAGVLVQPGPCKLVGQGVPIAGLVRDLSQQLGRSVVDQTGLNGLYDFTLDCHTAFMDRGDSLPMVLPDQLGLELKLQSAPVDVLVIDHAEKPSESQAENTAAMVPAFKVASVKLNNSVTQDNILDVPLGPEDVHFPNGGLFSGTNVRLISYIYFAYNLTGSQFQLLMPQLPKWVISDHFDIQAQPEGNLNKAQMRLMMQSLLADRFKLVTHYETQQLPVFALVSAKPGEFGPQLHPHRDNSPCSPATSTGSAPPATVAGGFPAICGSIIEMPSSPSGRHRVGARDVPLGLLATTLAQMGNFDRPVLDRTGLSGTFDFTFEWTPQYNGPGTPGAKVKLDESGPTFLEDLKDQLGLRLESQTGPTEIFVIDHVEKPSGN
jgi:bla regulator protein BlaR1